jgi:2-C-methyl-D-erythritol 4-phosphate cytidylyltransferase
MKTFVILPSGGRGVRFGGTLPKQYIKVNGKEILAYTIEIFEKCGLVNEIIIAADENYFQLINGIKEEYNFSKVTRVIKGGKERQDSVYNALSSLTCSNDDLIIVHDAVRPLLTQNILESAINSAILFDNVVVGIKAQDTLIEFDNIENHFATGYVDRSKIFYAQTPQIFRYSNLMDSMKKAYKENFIGTDESMLVMRGGFNVKIIDGSSQNLKITSENDLSIFDKLVRFNNNDLE